MELGGVTAVMGHNGAGKSMFLRLIHGLIAPDAASQSHDPLSAVTWDDLPAAQTRATRGFVFQKLRLMRRSVAANVAFPLLAKGMEPEAIKDEVAQALAGLNLTDFAARPAATLSGGEMARMSMARALVARPKVLLMDEPTASTDPEATQLIEQAMRDFVGGGGKAILVTHDEAQAARLALRTLRFEKGQLVE